MIKRGLPILLLLLILGIALKEPFLVTLATAILVIIGFAWWWKERSLRGVSYKRFFHYTRGFPGEIIDLKVEVENRKLLPISWLRVQDDWERGVGPEDEEILAPSYIQDRGYLTNIFSLHWNEKAPRQIPFTSMPAS